MKFASFGCDAVYVVEVCRRFGGTSCLDYQGWSTSDVNILATFCRYSNMPFCCITYCKLATAAKTYGQHRFTEFAGSTCKPNTRVHKSLAPCRSGHWILHTDT